MVTKISIIVPIYNVGKYLSKCIESIINQTLGEIQIILVNDGSTDNCGEIVDCYAKKDSRIQVIHKENGGVSSARNAGLEMARGEYIGFVDPDDWIELDMYELLYHKAQTCHAEMCVCGRSSYNDKNEKVYEIKLKEESISIAETGYHDYFFGYFFMPFTVSVCNKIYKSNVIKKHGLHFVDEKNIGTEDTLFNFDFMQHASEIGSIDKSCYCALTRSGSLARSYQFGVFDRMVNLVDECFNHSEKVGTQSMAKRIVPLIYIYFQQYNVDKIKQYAQEVVYKNIKEELKNIGNEKVFKQVMIQIILSRQCFHDMQKYGYRLRGIAFIKLYLLLCLFGWYGLAARIMTKA